MTQEEMEEVLEIGLTLSAESDFNRLWEDILYRIMKLTNCDAAALYLLKGEFLFFRILRNNTLNLYAGGDGNPPNLPPIKVSGENICALAVRKGKTICIDDIHNCREYKLPDSLRYDAMTGYESKSMLVVPMKNRAGEKTGVLQLVNAQDENGEICGFSPDLVMAVESVASQASLTIENMGYTEELRELFWSVVKIMSCAIDERTPYNASHTRHMAEYGERFVDYLNERYQKERKGLWFSPAHKQELMASIWFHDIGKLITPLEVMNKMTRLTPTQHTEIQHRMELIRLSARIRNLEGKITAEERDKQIAETKRAWKLIGRADAVGVLQEDILPQIRQLKDKTYVDEEGKVKVWLTDDEYEALSIPRGTLSKDERKIMEEHAELTDRLLSRLHFTRNQSHVREWAAAHHELLDGSGYPKGLKGDEIAPEIRIITILDIFDALVADDRPYKPGIPVEEALSVLTDMAEKEGKLDGELVRQFIESKCWETKEI